ncbi:MAG: hypothetical protein OXN17_13975 [Candidatus Poribacteria bacterium]|nr:hypothetical protein [Candidatus Poribacteria bacterium]MDE0504282.1 hypothetical protein [Candidatus Poribacteria bacterium]
MTEFQWQSDLIEVRDEADPIEVAYQKNWTDGLPVVPPTPERVSRMLAGTKRPPDEIIAQIPPKWGRATVERVAINAVMAGCKPEYMPVIIAAIEAMTDDAFSLHGVQVTTSLVSPLLIVNGPIRRELGINDSFNVFGQGWRSNATIGRAVRLVCTNIGGAFPGELDRATFGHSGKFTYCIGEGEEVSPWDPLHVDRGFQSSDSTVTVFAGASPRVIDDHGSNTAEGILDTICLNLAVPGIADGEIVIVMSPEHSKTVGDAGLTKREVQEYVHVHTKIDAAEDGKQSHHKPDEVIVMVAGGPAGRSTMAVSGWGSSTQAVTVAVAA